MLTYRVFIGGHVYAVDFVVCDVALNPLNLSAHLSQNFARLLRYCLELLRRKPAPFWNFSFDNELRHGNTSGLSFSGEEFEYLISASVMSTTVQRWARPPSALCGLTLTSMSIQGWPGLQATETTGPLAQAGFVRIHVLCRRVVVGEEKYLSGYPIGLSFMSFKVNLVNKLLSCSQSAWRS